MKPAELIGAFGAVCVCLAGVNARAQMTTTQVLLVANDFVAPAPAAPGRTLEWDSKKGRWGLRLGVDFPYRPRDRSARSRAGPVLQGDASASHRRRGDHCPRPGNPSGLCNICRRPRRPIPACGWKRPSSSRPRRPSGGFPPPSDRRWRSATSPMKGEESIDLAKKAAPRQSEGKGPLPGRLRAQTVAAGSSASTAARPAAPQAFRACAVRGVTPPRA